MQGRPVWFDDWSAGRTPSSVVVLNDSGKGLFDVGGTILDSGVVGGGWGAGLGGAKGGRLTAGACDKARYDI